MKKTNILFLSIVVLTVVLDQITKYYIHTSMVLHSSFPIIDGFFNITYIRNPGAAFGFLAGAPAIFRSLFFLAVTIMAISLILYYLYKTPSRGPLLTASLALILAGALGNMIDRLRFGEVIDFLDVYLGASHWPAFNIADSAISVGAVVLFLAMVNQGKEHERS
ncbi:MAG: signal peptidase II [Syntrophales bacterium]|nr:signal peptidase II [Syntrophales bacterium]